MYSLNWKLTVSTVLSSASRDAHAATGDRVILGSVSTQRRLSTVHSVTSSWTRCRHRDKHQVTCHATLTYITNLFAVTIVVSDGLTDVAARSYKSCWTFTGSSGRDTLSSIVTLALSFTVLTVTTLCTNYRIKTRFSIFKRPLLPQCNVICLRGVNILFHLLWSHLGPWNPGAQ